MADARCREVLEGVAPEWVALLGEVCEGEESALLAALSRTDVGAPVYGAEVADGTLVDFMWDAQRVVTGFHLDDETVEHLARHGWHVVEPDVNAIVEALHAPEGVC